MTGSTVLRFRRPDGSAHWSMEVFPLTEDEFGRWFKADAGWVMERPGKKVVVDHPSIWLLPHRGDFVARFNGHRQDGNLPGSDLYVDICADRTVEQGAVWLTELDLDVVRSPDGTVSLVDEVEFLAHIGEYKYSWDLVRTAVLTSDSVLNEITQAREPFGGIGASYLREAFGA